MTQIEVKPEPLVIRTDFKGAKVTLYMGAPWPRHCLLDQGLFCDRPQFASVDDNGRIILTCANGTATYKLCRTQIQNNAMTVELETSTYVEPPPDPSVPKSSN